MKRKHNCCFALISTENKRYIFSCVNDMCFDLHAHFVLTLNRYSTRV